MIQSIPKLVIGNFLKLVTFQSDDQTKHIGKDHMLSNVPSFIRMIERLIAKSKSDWVDSIKIEAQTSLRLIIKKLKNSKGEVENILEKLNRS